MSHPNWRLKTGEGSAIQRKLVYPHTVWEDVRLDQNMWKHQYTCGMSIQGLFNVCFIPYYEKRRRVLVIPCVTLLFGPLLCQLQQHVLADTKKKHKILTSSHVFPCHMLHIHSFSSTKEVMIDYSDQFYLQSKMTW